MKVSFKVKLASYFGGVILVACLAIGIAMIVISSNKLENMRNQSSEDIANETLSAIENYIETYNMAIDMLSKDSNVTSAPFYYDSMPWLLKTFKTFTESFTDADFVYVGYEDSSLFKNGGIKTRLQDFYGSEKTDAGVLVVDEATKNAENGFFTYSHFYGSDYDHHVRGWYEAAKATKDTIWTDTYTDAFTGLPVITVAKQIVDSDGGTLGVIGADISLSNLAETYGDKEIGNTGYMFITDGAGVVISHPDPEQLGAEVKDMEFWSDMSSGESGFVHYEYNDEKKYLYFTTEPNTGWKIAVPFAENEVSEDTRPLIISSIVLIAVAVIIGIIIAIYIAVKITIDLNKVNVVLSKVAIGDLTEKVNITRRDEIGSMGENLNQTIDTLSEIVMEINQTSADVKNDTDNLTAAVGETTKATEEIAQSIQDVAHGTTTQAMEVQDGSDKTASVSEKITVTNNLSNEMGKLSDEVKSDSEYGLKTMKNLKEKAEEKVKSSAQLDDIIRSVDEQSRKIGDITQTIASIADQTNLLALNASIESARAGEAGRGFAVVADEIRKLAEQSSVASGDIKELIDNMQSQSTIAVKTVEINRSIDQEEFSAVQETEETFNRIFDRLDVLLGSLTKIKEQNNDIDADAQSLLDVMSTVSSVTEETSAASEQVSASTEEQLAAMEEITSQTVHLRESIENLHALISRFKI
jgi:methyl-accepting chemotaxis protein